MQYDLLLNPGRFAWAVNCSVGEGSVHIGALYLEPNVPTEIIRLESGNEFIDVVLPEEFLRARTAQRAWNLSLPLVTADDRPSR